MSDSDEKKPEQPSEQPAEKKTEEPKAPMPGSHLKLLTDTSKHFTRALARIFKDLDITPDQALRMVAFGLDLSPRRFDAILAATKAATGEDSAGFFVSSMMTMFVNSFMEAIGSHQCPCRFCEARAKVMADPSKENHLEFARAMLETREEDPGVIIKDCAERTGLSEAEVAQIYKEAQNPADVVEIVATILMKGRDKANHLMDVLKHAQPPDGSVN